MPLLGRLPPRRALEGERLGHDADGQRARRSRAISATIGAAPVPVPPPMPAVTNTMSASPSDFLELARGSPRRRARRPPPCPPATESLGRPSTRSGCARCVRQLERLRVGVDRDELDSLQALGDHPVDGVRAAAADADHLDPGQAVCIQHVWHRVIGFVPPCGGVGCVRSSPATVVVGWSGDPGANESTAGRGPSRACALTSTSLLPAPLPVPGTTPARHSPGPGRLPASPCRARRRTAASRAPRAVHSRRPTASAWPGPRTASARPMTRPGRPTRPGTPQRAPRRRGSPASSRAAADSTAPAARRPAGRPPAAPRDPVGRARPRAPPGSR